MKFLCLHGAYSSAESLSVQLGRSNIAESTLAKLTYTAPLEQELELHNISLRYVNAPFETKLPDGYEAFDTWFGQSPHYRWTRVSAEETKSLLSRLRCIRPSEAPEDAVRYLLADDKQSLSRYQSDKGLDLLYRTLNEDPEIEGILAYSEGAMTASTFVLNEMKKAGESRQIKCAIFFNGGPPLGPDGKLVLADESELRIDIPTLHVVGANDPFKPVAIALYNVCDSNTAEFFDGARGHTVPRSALVVNELSEAIQNLIERTQDAS